MQDNKLFLSDGQLLITCFSKLKDPRVLGRVDYPLIEIIIISICAIICGANHWKAIADFGKAKEDWLKTFLELENGIPSAQTFGRVFSLICPKKLLDCFKEWCKKTTGLPEESIIAIDGKTVRKSGCKSIGFKPLHLINAYAIEQKILLSSSKTPDKTNEIKAIPVILKDLPLEKNIVTMDAMGTQKGIINLIRLQKAHYCVALKKNHKRFYKKVNNLFHKAESLAFNAMVFKRLETFDYDHSRIEERTYCFLPIMYLFQFKSQWKDLETLIQVRRIRYLSNGGKEESIHYYISSLPLKKSELITKAIRGHWAVENGLHYKLDVGLNEDNCRIFHPHAAENFSTLRKLVLACLERDKSSEEGILLKRWKAALNENYLRYVIGF